MPVYPNEEYLRIVRPLPNFVRRDIYSIPIIERQDVKIACLGNGQSLINLNNANVRDRSAHNKIVHSFSNDATLRRHYNHPYAYLHKIGRYYAVSSFDFSISPQMDFKQVLSAVYDNRWSGAFLQAHGKIVLPTVGWVGKDYYDICLAGLANGSTFIISTLGTHNSESEIIFIEGYHELRRRYPNSKLICVGDRLPGMDSDVCYIHYENSFGNDEIYKGYWQPSMINWDGTLALGGEE